jgi:hypothetical protein
MTKWASIKVVFDFTYVRLIANLAYKSCPPRHDL